jgi:hypothetical protein
LWANKKISDEQYIDGLKDSEENIRSLLTELNAIDKEMFNAYENALDGFNSELADKTDELSHMNSMLDHYLTIMDLTGRS